MRILVWFAIGFSAACAAGVYALSGLWLVIPAVLCLVAGVLLLLVKTRTLRAGGILLLGCALGLAWQLGYDLLYLRYAGRVDGEIVHAAVTVTDYSSRTDYGVSVDGTITLEGKEFAIRIYDSDGEALRPGDCLEGDFRLRLTTDKGIQGATYHQGNGIFLLGYAKENVVCTAGEKIPAKYMGAVMRKEILNILDSVFPADTLGFARALLLGDSSRLTYEEDTAFRVSGIRHVIAVSGLHVSILFSLVYMVAGRRRYLTALIGIPVLVVFAAVAGFTPSVVRACIMQGLVVLALMLNKEYDPPTALAAAVMVMLLVNPMTVTSVSFQLSVGCMVGIFLFSQKIHDYLLKDKRAAWAKGKSLRAKLVRWIVASISVTLSAMVATTPLCAIYFGTVSLIGIITNLLTVWVVSFIFYGIMLSCVLGAVWLPAGKLAAWCTSWLIRYVLLAAKGLSQLPLAAVYTDSVYIVIWLVTAYLLLAVFVLYRRKQPAMLAAGIVLSLGICVGASHIEPRTDDICVTVLDVGQGQCILVQTEGKHYMVDCGGDTPEIAADRASQLLLSQGISTLDGVVLTHYDKDHAAGLELLMTRIRVKNMYLPDIADDTGTRQTLERLAPDRVQIIDRHRILTDAGLKISLFPPLSGTEDNESSMCVLFQRENYDILITGDRSTSGEQQLLEETELPELELLVVGHHGSNSSTGFPLLEAARPKLAAISVSEDNSYGHPARQVLTRLELIGTKVLRTDLQGDLIFRG